MHCIGLMAEVAIKDVFQFRAAVAEEALKNPDFAASLKENPQAALTQFSGTDCSKLKVSIIEEDEDTLVLPIAKVTDELTAEQLEAIAGGAFFAAITVSAVCAVVGASAAVAASTCAVIETARG